MTDHAGEVRAEIRILDPALMSANTPKYESRHVLDYDRKAFLGFPPGRLGVLSFGQIVEYAHEADETAACVNGRTDREIRPELSPVLAIVQDLPSDRVTS
jgi:hypothetical protein